MPFARCRHYTEEGAPIGSGCARGELGGCGFVHPSHPNWSRAPSSNNFGRGGGRGGAPSDRGALDRGWRGRGRGGRSFGDEGFSHRRNRSNSGSVSNNNEVQSNGCANSAWDQDLANQSSGASGIGTSQTTSTGWGNVSWGQDSNQQKSQAGASQSATTGWGNIGWGEDTNNSTEKSESGAGWGTSGRGTSTTDTTATDTPATNGWGAAPSGWLTNTSNSAQTGGFTTSPNTTRSSWATNESGPHTEQGSSDQPNPMNASKNKFVQAAEGAADRGRPPVSARKEQAPSDTNPVSQSPIAERAGSSMPPPSSAMSTPMVPTSNPSSETARRNRTTSNDRGDGSSTRDGSPVNKPDHGPIRNEDSNEHWASLLFKYYCAWKDYKEAEEKRQQHKRLHASPQYAHATPAARDKLNSIQKTAYLDLDEAKRRMDACCKKLINYDEKARADLIAQAYSASTAAYVAEAKRWIESMTLVLKRLEVDRQKATDLNKPDAQPEREEGEIFHEDVEMRSPSPTPTTTALASQMDILAALKKRIEEFRLKLEDLESRDVNRAAAFHKAIVEAVARAVAPNGGHQQGSDVNKESTFQEIVKEVKSSADEAREMLQEMKTLSERATRKQAELKVKCAAFEAHKVRGAREQAENRSAIENLRRRFQEMASKPRVRAPPAMEAQPPITSHDILAELEPTYRQLIAEDIVPVLESLRDASMAQIDERFGHLRRAVWEDFRPLLDFLAALNGSTPGKA